MEPSVRYTACTHPILCACICMAKSVYTDKQVPIRAYVHLMCLLVRVCLHRYITWVFRGRYRNPHCSLSQVKTAVWVPCTNAPVMADVFMRSFYCAPVASRAAAPCFLFSHASTHSHMATMVEILDPCQMSVMSPPVWCGPSIATSSCWMHACCAHVKHACVG